MPDLPPWLNIDPTAPVGRLLEGYRSGLAASQAQQQAGERAQEFAIRQQELAQLAAYRQQQQDIQLSELRLAQEKAQREAAASALQVEGQRGLQTDLQAGLSWPQALAKWSPKLFAGNPVGLATAMERIRQPRPPVFGTSPEGYGWVQNQETGATSFVPASIQRLGQEPTIHQTPEGQTYFVDPNGVPHFVPAGYNRTINDAGHARLGVLNRDRTRLYKELGGIPESQAVGEDADKFKQIHNIEAESDAILQGNWQPGQQFKAPETTEKKLTLEQGRDFIRQAGGDPDKKPIPADVLKKARDLAKSAGFTF